MAQDDFLQKLDASYSEAAKAPAPAAPASQPVQTPEEASGGVGAFVKDAGQALAGGVEAAGRGTLQTISSIAQLGGADVPDVPQETMIANPQYGFNKVVKDITQYGLGFLAGGPILKAAGVASKGAAAMMAQSAIGTGIVADPHAERLSNLLQSYPFLEKPMSLLAADPTDSAAAGKLKAALEDAFTTPVAMGLFKAIHYGYVSTRGLLKPGSKEALHAEADLAQTLSQLNEAAESGALKAEKYAANVALPDKSLDLFKANPTMVHAGREEVAVKDLHLEHTLDDKGTESAFKYADKYRNGQDVEDLVVRRDADGKLHVMSGNARTVGAGQAGKEKLHADIFMDKATVKQAQTAEKFGGEKQMDAAAAKAQKAREMFNLTDEQKKYFDDRIKANLLEGETNELFRDLPEGAFNYAKMDSPTKVHEVMQAMADTIEPNLKNTAKNYMSFKEMQSTAALFGAKPDVMLANLRSWGVDGNKIAPTLLAAKSWAQSLSQEIYRDARSIAIMGTGGQTAQVEMLRKISVLADIEGMLKSVQTAAARTTAAGRIRTTPRYTAEQMKQMLDEMGGMGKVGKLAEKLALAEGDPAKMMSMLRVSWQRKVVDSHNELWMNALLSGPSTHEINIGSALLNTFVKPGNIALGGIMRGDKASVDLALGTWKGLSSMVKDSWEMSRRAWQIERPILSVSDKQLEVESTISAANYNLNPESWFGQGINYMGKLARIPSRFLGAEDEFFKQLSYRAHLQSQATQEAMTLVRQGKLDMNKMVELEIGGKTKKVSEVQAYVQKKFDEGFQYQEMPEFSRPVQGETGNMRQVQGVDPTAKQYANEVTFTQDLKVPTWLGNRSFAETVYQAANSHPVLRGTVLPFVKVPANLLREAYSYTPGIAQLRKKFWADLAEGGERASEAIGKMATGSTLLAGGTMLAVEGKMTGASPTDPDVRKRLMESGWQPYSFVFENDNGEKTYVPYNRFDPYGTVFGIVADIAQTFQHHPEDARHNVAASATMAVANLLNGRSYLKGLVDALDILAGGQGQDGIDKFNRLMTSKVGSYVPNLAKAANPDTELKEVRSMVDAMLAKTPGLSESVPAKRGYFGDKLMSPVGFPWHGLLPTKPSDSVTDPALLELARLSEGPSGAHFSGPEKRVGTLDLTRYKNSEGVTAYDKMLENLSKTDFHDKMNELVQSERYQSGTDGDAYYPGSKQVMIKKLETKYHQQALQMTLKEFESEADALGYNLRDMFKQDQKNARASKHGRETSEIDRLLEFAQ